jgi:hypothetical protein
MAFGVKVALVSQLALVAKQVVITKLASVRLALIVKQANLTLATKQTLIS